MHTMADYVSVGVFLGSAACSGAQQTSGTGLADLRGAELAVMLLTDYPGGMTKFFSFATHREMDYGLAADGGHHARVSGLQGRG